MVCVEATIVVEVCEHARRCEDVTTGDKIICAHGKKLGEFPDVRRCGGCFRCQNIYVKV